MVLPFLNKACLYGNTRKKVRQSMQNVIPVSLAQGRGYRGICGKRNFPQAPFERYADDGMIHCRTREEELSKFDFLAREKAKRYNIHINDMKGGGQHERG